MDTQKKYKKVYFEMYTKEGYQGRWIYSQRHMKFSEADVPELFKKRPYQESERGVPDYLYKIDKDGIYIGLFYDGLPDQTKQEDAT